jgi:hypothetical protein
VNSLISKVAKLTKNFKPVQIQKVTLVAREEKNPPRGQPHTPNRDIGFATVFIRSENHKEEDSKITIMNIQIVNVSDSKLQDFKYPQKEIMLHPLENSEQAFEIKNKTGYSGNDQVKAVVTYQIDNQVSSITSEPVTIYRL